MSRTLVLIEDDPGDAFLVTEMLLDVAPELTVTTFSTLAAALADWPADPLCVLLDLGLPDSIGLSALRKLRADVPETPVVVLTGRVDDQSGPEALATGAQDYLVKGQVDGSTLERSVRYAIERGRALSFQRDLVASEIRAHENARLERGLLPSPMLTSGRLQVAQTYRPGRERALLGGDFYDVVEMPNGEVQLLIGDVSGHGADEAALGVALRIAWRALVLAGLGADDVLAGVEQVLIAERDHDERFATCVMITLTADLTQATLRLAGHPAPLLATAEGVVELTADIAPALALVPGTPCPGTTITFGETWGLVLFTDGLVEGTDGVGTLDRYGTEGVRKHLIQLLEADTNRDVLGPALISEAEARQGGPLTDDVAILVVGTSSWWR